MFGLQAAGLIGLERRGLHCAVRLDSDENDKHQNYEPTFLCLFLYNRDFSLENINSRDTSTSPMASDTCSLRFRWPRADFLGISPLKPVSKAGRFVPVVKIKIIPTRNFWGHARFSTDRKSRPTCTRIIFFSQANETGLKFPRMTWGYRELACFPLWICVNERRLGKWKCLQRYFLIENYFRRVKKIFTCCDWNLLKFKIVSL